MKRVPVIGWSLFLLFNLAVAQETVLRRWDFSAGAEGWIAAHDVADLAATAGVLRLTTTGRDAYIMVDPGRLATARAHLLRVRMKSDQPGRTQVYFTTSQSRDPAGHAIPSFQIAGDDTWRNYEVRMLGADGWSGALTMLRLDPVNPAVGARVEIDWVELVTLAPVWRIESLAPDRTWIARGATFHEQIRVRNVGGPIAGEPPRVQLQAEGASRVGEARVTLDGLARADVASACWTLTAGAGASCVMHARLVGATGDLLGSAESGLMLGTAEDATPELHNQRVGLAVRDGREMLLFARVGGRWRVVALARPLARLAIGEPMRMVDVTLPAKTVVDGDTMVLRDGATQGPRVTLQLSLDGDIIKCGAQLSPRAASETLLHFSGPTLLVPGTGKRGALFPGVEYLNADEPSSRADIIGRRFAPRSVPPAHWITIPLMAVQSDAALVGLLWQPTLPWARGHAQPAALFASPNFVDGQDNHLMQLFVPGVGDGSEPNERVARRGLPLDATTGITLDSAILISPDAPDVLSAVDAWMDRYGLPDVPPPPRDATRTEAICMHGFRDTMYEPGQGWTNHWGLGETPWRNLDFIARLVAYAHRTGDVQWLAHTDAAMSGHLVDILGPVDARAGSPPPQMATQRPDGSWGYEETEETRRKCRDISRNESDTLGEPGSTNVGICAIHARPVLEYALAWGEPAAVNAASRALAAMLRFRVPAGAQTWEVHKDIPDINAAGHACECFRMGYELFGDRRYLDAAVYWARTGLAFIYLWNAPISPEPATILFNGVRGGKAEVSVKSAGECYEHPERRILPYASIPVFGTSFYAVPWYGHPVQWCGLVWAEATLQLCNRHGDEIDATTARVLRTAAQGVLTSARWQQLDMPPYTGLLPDSWHLEDNTAFAAMIGPMRIHDCLLASENISDGRAIDTHVFRDGDRRIHLATRGRLRNPSQSEGGLRYEVKYLPGEPFECALTPFRASVATLTVDGVRLDSTSDDPRTPHYAIRTGRPQLNISLIGAGAWQRVEVLWEK